MFICYCRYCYSRRQMRNGLNNETFCKKMNFSDNLKKYINIDSKTGKIRVKMLRNYLQKIMMLLQSYTARVMTLLTQIMFVTLQMLLTTFIMLLMSSPPSRLVISCYSIVFTLLRCLMERKSISCFAPQLFQSFVV